MAAIALCWVINQSISNQSIKSFLMWLKTATANTKSTIDKCSDVI